MLGSGSVGEIKCIRLMRARWPFAYVASILDAGKGRKSSALGVANASLAVMPQMR